MLFFSALAALCVQLQAASPETMVKTPSPVSVSPFMNGEEGEASLITCFIYDNDGEYTNIRNAPKGDIIAKISTKHDVVVTLVEAKNGWFRIVGGYDLEDDDDLDLPRQAWIHNSVIAFGTTNYDGSALQLRAKPQDNSSVTYTFRGEQLVRPLSVNEGGWVYVKMLTGNHKGWIRIEHLCGNPVTNCC